jgi:CBS domain containing-hemolysin-like protein
LKYKAIFVIPVLLAAPDVFAAGGGAPGEASGPATQLDVVLLASYILLALLVSFLCSIAEAVLLSITPSYIASLRQEHPKTAKLIARLKQENVDQSLAAILTLNTIAHTVGAIGAGAKATVVFGSAWFGLFSAVMTLLILFLSEIIPKTLGAVYWRSLASPIARFVQMLILGLYPLIYVSELLTRFIARGKKVHAFNREEFVAMAGEGERGGHLDENESRIIQNLFRFKSLTAADVMTPRTVIHALPADKRINAALELAEKWPFSRIPIYEDDIDQIAGFILRGDLLTAAAQDTTEDVVSTLRREIMATPEKTSLSKLLDQMLDQREHIAVVVGEYGDTRGLVTLEDVVETLLGMEIVDEVDRVEDMQVYARRQWERRAKALGVELEEPEKSDTVDSSEQRSQPE